MKERIASIDIAKAFCIVLVVFGHFNPETAPAWWDVFIKFIYTFHMPAFMFLSGILYAYSDSGRNYGQFVTRKTRRLMLPYLCASAIIIGIKLLSQNLLPVKNPVSVFAFVEMLWKPSAAFHLWFILVLMVIFVIVPLFKSEIWLYSLFAVSMMMWIIGMKLPQTFALDHLPRMLPFFVCGILWKRNNLRIKNKYAVIALFLLIESVYLIQPSTGAVLKFILPFLGIGTVISISESIDSRTSPFMRNCLVQTGKCSFFIYLFHSTCSEFAKSALSLAGISPANAFVLCMLICVIAGVAIPMFIQKFIVDRSGILSGIFGKS